MPGIPGAPDCEVKLRAVRPTPDVAAWPRRGRLIELRSYPSVVVPQSTLSATRTDAVLNPTGLVFKLYRDHFGTLPVDVSGNAPPPAPRYPVGGDQPQVNAGSSTYPLDVSASLTPDRSALTIAVINPTTSAQTLALTIRGAAPAAAGARLWQLAPSSVDATIVVGQKPGVVVENVALGALPATLTIPRFSVGIYVLPISTAGSR